MSQDAISVVMPARNCAKTIGIAIESIIGQTYPNLELIVVDDNSTDSTFEVAQDYAKRYDNVRCYALPFDDPHRIGWNGVNVNAGWMARNYGMERADGDWITLQGADDASLLNRIAVQYDFAQRYGSSHVCLDWQMYDDAYLGKYLDAKRILDLHGEENLIVKTEEILALARRCRGLIPTYFGWLHKRVPHHWKLHPLVSLYSTLLTTEPPRRPLRGRTSIPGNPERVVYRSMLSGVFRSGLSKFVRRSVENWVEKLFFGDLSLPYPGCAGPCLVNKDVFPRVRFHPLNERVWPSRRGRGADRDFNFAVVELVKDSISVRLPLYLWRVGSDHPAYGGAEYVPVECQTSSMHF